MVRTRIKLSRMMINSRLVYLDGKTIKDLQTFKPEIEDVDYDFIEENYEVSFFDKSTGILKLEKWDKNVNTLYTLGGFSPEELKEMNKKEKTTSEK